MRERQLAWKKKKKKDKVIIMLPATLDFPGLTPLSFIYYRSSFYLEVYVRTFKKSLRVSRLEADNIAPDIFKTWIKSQENLVYCPRDC